MAQAFKRLLFAASFLVCAPEVAGQSVTAAPTPTGPPFSVYLPENRTRQSVSVIVDLQPDQFPHLACWYPISGSYCTLPRALFYITIIAALVLRHYPWLRVGALAASLTYSGAAAIHSCLIIWSRRAFGELDVIPLVGVLSASCFVMVPLLTWSSTIRHAGKSREENRYQEEKLARLLERLNEQEDRAVSGRQEQRPAIAEQFSRRRKRLEARNKQSESRSDDLDIASRTILFMWACLVTAGFICAFVAITDQSPNSRYGHFRTYDGSRASEISCRPENGTLNLTNGDGTYYWGQFFITSDFLDVNNCIDPCPISPTVSGPLWFRDFGDLQSLTEADLIYANGDSVSGSQLTLILSYAHKWSWIWVYVIAQGIWAVCLGRNQPYETRIQLYGFISHLLTKKDPETSPWIKVFAKAVAFSVYLGAVSIAIIALPLLLLNVTLIELYTRQLPQSETPKHVGAWSPYAVIGLALLSFFFANVQINHHIKGFWTTISNMLRSARACVMHRERESENRNPAKSKRSLRKFWFAIRTLLTDYIIEQRNDVLDALQEEWTYARRTSGRIQMASLPNTNRGSRKPEKMLKQ